ncbi:MAG: DUF1631 family protein [Xanthomonadales bacterium]|nr:DUF1631 family protein [Xanthomonadales bacterium]
MDPPATPPPEAPSRLRLYRALQGSSRWFAERFAELRQEAERMLAAAAAKATDPVAARALADARAVFQREAPQLEHRWLAALARRIAAIAGDAAPRPERGPLALVEDGELEVALAIAPLTRQARRLCAEEWGAARGGLRRGLPRHRRADGLWPLDPAAVIAAFREATAELRPFDRDALLLLLDALGTSVLARLPELYRALLAELAGLLPGPAPQGRTGEGQEPRRAPSQPRPPRCGRGSRSMLGPPAAETAADAPTAELLHALSLLQGGEVRGLGEAPAGASLKPLLLKRLAGLRGGGVPRLRPRDERGIDLVGLVFELLLRDEAIPAAGAARPRPPADPLRQGGA